MTGKGIIASIAACNSLNRRANGCQRAFAAAGENIDAVDRAGHTLQRRRCADALGGCTVTAMMFSIAGTPLAVGSLLLRLLLPLRVDSPPTLLPRLIPLSASACRSCGIAASTAARTWP